MEKTLKSELIWVGFNLLGMGIYLSVESWIMTPRATPEEQLNGIDEICLWFGLDFPIVIACLALNLAWLGFISKPLPLRNTKLGIWIVTCLLWIAVLAYHGLVSKIILLFTGRW